MSTPPRDENTHQSMAITAEQEKLLYNATRIRILRALNNRTMTAQQIAETLAATKGNVHYHVQRLYEGGLLDLVETRPSGGILEKYYRAKASLYTRKGDTGPSRQGDNIQQIQTTLTLTESQLQQFNQELVDLLMRFEEETVVCSEDEADDYTIQVVISKAATTHGDNDVRPSERDSFLTDKPKNQ